MTLLNTVLIFGSLPSSAQDQSPRLDLSTDDQMRHQVLPEGARPADHPIQTDSTNNVPDGAKPSPRIEDRVQSDQEVQTLQQHISFDAKPDEVAHRLTPADMQSLITLTNEILEKEIELLQLNTDFRIATTESGWAKPWRVFSYNLLGSGAATAGITTIAAERWRTWRTPAAANRNTLKAGPTLLLISHSIIAAGVLAEATSDAIADCKQCKRGFDRKTTKKHAIELKDAIDEKLTQRDSLVANLAENDKALALAEGQVLRDLRDRALSEYCQFDVRAAKRKTARNVAYLNGFSAATTGGYLGSLCGLLAVANRNPRLAGPAGIGFTISGANIATGPILGRMTANVAGSLAKRRLNRDIGTFAPPEFKAHFDLLKKSSLQDDPNFNTRIAIYQDVDALLRRQAEMNAAEKKKADKEFIERCLFNAAIGGTKIGWGCQLANAGFGFHAGPAPKAPTLPVKFGGKTVQVPVGKKPLSPSQLFSKRVAQGATTYIPGTSLWILDTVQSRTRGEMDLYTMGAQAALPHQKLNARMNELNMMQKKLKGQE